MSIYYTADEVAKELRVNRRTVYEWLRSGRLRGIRAGKAWRIGDEDLASFLERADGSGLTGIPSDEESHPEGSSRTGAVYVIQIPLGERPGQEVDAGPIVDPEQASKNEGAIRLLDSWLEEGDEEEQRETGEFLMRALDEDRLSYRKVMP